MREPLVISVPGTPRPAGSKKAFQHRATGKMLIVDMGGKHGRLWRQSVGVAAKAAYHGPPLDGPLLVTFHFVMPYPKAERTRPVGGSPHTHRPDTTKLVRAVEDSLTGIVWHDDAQIICQTATKLYGHHPGVTVMVQCYGNRPALAAPRREGQNDP